MQITQLRNATVVVAYDDCRILIDPMLADQGAIPPFKWLTDQRRRNPIVPLPAGTDDHLAGVTHALITHCRKGHVDHLDRAGTRWLRERGLPVLCMPGDADFLRQRGLNVEVLCAAGPTPFRRGTITPIPCRHGEGWIGRFMMHGYGYHIEQADAPSVYIAGDTVLTDDVRRCITERKPDVSIVPAGGASMDFGAELIMDDEQVLALAQLGSGLFVANHLEALDHCPVRRVTLRGRAEELGLSPRLLVPDDGQTLSFASLAPAAACR